MKKNLFIIVLCFSFTYIVNAQVYEEWVQRYNGPGNGADEYPKTAIDNFGNLYVTGTSQGSGSGEDFVTIKYNSDGLQQWVQRYNGPGNSFDRSNAIAVDNVGNVYVTGTSYAGPSPATGSDYVTIKYNSFGILQWIQRYNGPGNGADEARNIAVDNSGNIYVTGWSDSAGIPTNYYDYATIKYSSTGIQQWVKRYNGPGNGSDQATEITIDNSGNVYVSGQSKGIGTDFDVATIKYNSSGTVQWVQRYNSTINGKDAAYGIAADNGGNVYVTGISNGITTGFDYLTLKYNSSGNLQWFKTYNGTQNQDDFSHSIQLDNFGNVYISGTIQNNGSAYDFATIKYSSSGIQQWIQIYSGPASSWDLQTDMKIDGSTNIYVTGYGNGNGISPNNYDYVSVKYNSSGELQWIQSFNGPANGEDLAFSIEVISNGNIFVAGNSIGTGTGRDLTTIKYSQQQLSIIQPSPFAKWISGETSTIQWTGWTNVNIKCILNFGTALQSEEIIATNIFLTQTEYPWTIPENTLSYQSKIIIENAVDPTQKIESGIFRIKPYLLTRVNPDSTYYEYKKNRDQWGFWNDSSQMFPHLWYQQFDYQGIDPFTGLQYSQWELDGVFRKAQSKNFPDWISFVNTFSVDSCYWNTSFGRYKFMALLNWAAKKDSIWSGSCFGLAISNGIIFNNKEEFISKYSNFPFFNLPINLLSGNYVRKTINELFTHQFGQPHVDYKINIGSHKSPTQTLNELKEILLNDNDTLRTLSFYDNSPRRSGGHAVVPYLVKQDINNTDNYFVFIYDNAIPFSNNPIEIKTLDSAGRGSWSTPDWSNWGGDKGFFLRDQAYLYLNNPTFNNSNIEKSSFALSSNVFEIYNPGNPYIRVKDSNGNITGFKNDSILINIPNSYPLILDNGKETPPYGYKLASDNYTILLDDFVNDTIKTFIFTGNKAFSYERYGAIPSQTDKLFLNGDLSISNSDPEVKTINVLNVKKESTNEKLFNFRSLDMAQNDSVKIENLGIDNFKLTSYGSSKSYDIELNLASQSQLGRFMNVNIPLPSNSSHTFIPNWNNVTTSQLVILQDIGNNGTIDDTIRVINIISNIEQGSLILPDNYSLYQNYPNPFNPSTVIKYDIKYDGLVTLKVYNILGSEVASLVSEVKQAGRYEVEFNGSNLGSGVYYYRLQAGDFSETKRMLLLK